jgi:hypothetical protein
MLQSQRWEIRSQIFWLRGTRNKNQLAQFLYALLLYHWTEKDGAAIVRPAKLSTT